jgi:hypothetical protein
VQFAELDPSEALGRMLIETFDTYGNRKSISFDLANMEEFTSNRVPSATVHPINRD